MSTDEGSEFVVSEGHPHDEAAPVSDGDAQPAVPLPATNEPTSDGDGVAVEDDVQPVPTSPPSKLRRIGRFIGRNADIFDVFGS